MFVDFSYAPLLEDFYDNGELKLETILKILENSGNRHSDLAGDAILAGSAGGTAWILTDWYVELDSCPKYGDTVSAKTWSQGATSLFGTSREFEFYCNGNLCGRGTTRWVLFDLNANRPAKVTEDLLEKYGPEKKAVFAESKLPKITIPDEFSNEVSIVPRRNDIDFNHHVHNLVYVDYAMEALPQDVYKSHSFKKIRITYKAAVKAGETIVAKYANLDGSHIVCIYGTDGALKTVISLSA